MKDQVGGNANRVNEHRGIHLSRHRHPVVAGCVIWCSSTCAHPPGAASGFWSFTGSEGEGGTAMMNRTMPEIEQLEARQCRLGPRLKNRCWWPHAAKLA